MPVENKKSTIVANLDQVPARQNSLGIAGARLREEVGTLEVAAADDDGSVFRFARVRSSDRVSSIEIFNDAITGGTAYEVGLHRTAADGGAAVDHDLFATAVSMATARVAPLDVTFEALDIIRIEQPLWQMLGLSADPYIDYDVTMTATTIGTAPGTISVRLRYVDNT
jgi:glycine cleavage system aminomethyltransferase T